MNAEPDQPEAWIAEAACDGFDPEIFFPRYEDEYDFARSICAECEVSAECLDFALRENITHGMWGGKTGRERKRIRRALTRG